MIATDLTHISRQMAMTPALRKGFDFLREHSGRRTLTTGRIAVDGDRVVASIQSYTTVVTETPQMEAHGRYIDLQYIVAGEEALGWAPLEKMRVTQAYDGEKDNCFGMVPPGEVTRIHLHAGQLAVFYPEDAHAPKLAVGAPAAVTKIVVKVAVE